SGPSLDVRQRPPLAQRQYPQTDLADRAPLDLGYHQLGPFPRGAASDLGTAGAQPRHVVAKRQIPLRCRALEAVEARKGTDARRSRHHEPIGVSFFLLGTERCKKSSRWRIHVVTLLSGVVQWRLGPFA